MPKPLRTQPRVNSGGMVFLAPTTIEAADSMSPAKTRRFNMEAYDGGPLSLPAFPYPVIVDLAGLEVGNQRRPVLLDHKKDADHVVGQTDMVTASATNLIASGEVMGTSPEVLRAIELNDKGFRWESSIGAKPLEKLRLIKAGQSLFINGRDQSGPVLISTRTKLGEISFVVIGAAETSAAHIAASAAGDWIMGTFEEYLAAMGFTDPATLSDQQRTSLQAMYDAEASEPGEPAPAAPAVAAGGVVAPAAPARPAAPAVAATVGQLSISAGDQLEINRINAVSSVCFGPRGQFPEIEAQAISEGWTVKDTSLAVLRASRPKAPAIVVRSNVRNQEVIEASMALATGLDANMAHERGWYSEQVLEAAQSEAWRGMTLCRLGHEIVAAAGGHINSGRIQTDGVYHIFNAERRLIEAAGPSGVSTISMQGVLGNLANKHLLNAFQEIESVIPQIAFRQSTPDYKQFKSFAVTMNGGLQPIGADGQLKLVGMKESEYANQVGMHGAILTISEVTFVNDDLGVFTQVPTMFGRAAGTHLEEVGFTEFLDDAAFFTTANGNYFEGADSDLGIDSLSLASMMADEMKDDNNKFILQPFNRILVPPSLKVLAGDLYKEKNIVVAGNTDVVRTAGNSHVGSFAPMSSPYVGTKSSITGKSNTHFWIMGPNNDMAPLQVAYLNGVDKPTIEKGEVNFNQLGMSWRVVFRFGVAKGNKRGAIKSKGKA